ncbi:MAG: VOC family protein [Pseudomonadota bacterium]
MLRLGTLIAFVCIVTACGGSGPEPIDRTKTIVRGINYIGVTVSDINAAEALYAGGANLKRIDGIAPDDISASLENFASQNTLTDVRLMRSVNAQLLFMQFDEASGVQAVPVEGPGIAHVCYQVAKSTNAYQTFLANGATHIGDPEMVQLNPSNPVEYAYARDPDGIVMEIEHVDVDALDLPEPPAHQHRIRQVELSTPDINRAVKFYSTLLEEPKPRRAGRFLSFGNEKVDRVSGLEGSKIKMAWFQVRNLELEIIQFTSHPTDTPETPRPINALGYNIIVFEVADIEAARAKLIDAGGTLVGDIISTNDGRILFGRDPDGNLLGFQTLPMTSALSSQNFANDGT